MPFLPGGPPLCLICPSNLRTFLRLWQREWIKGRIAGKPDVFLEERTGRCPFHSGTARRQAAPRLANLPRRHGELSAARKAAGAAEIPDADEQQATLFMILEAAFMAVLHRYTGQDDIVVGTPKPIRN